MYDCMDLIDDDYSDSMSYWESDYSSSDDDDGPITTRLSQSIIEGNFERVHKCLTKIMMATAFGMDLDLGDMEPIAVRYCMGFCILLESKDKEQVRRYLTMLDKYCEVNGKYFPGLYFLASKLYNLIPLHNKAKEALEKCKRLLKESKEIRQFHWPGTKNVIDESVPSLLMASMNIWEAEMRGTVRIISTHVEEAVKKANLSKYTEIIERKTTCRNGKNTQVFVTKQYNEGDVSVTVHLTSGNSGKSSSTIPKKKREITVTINEEVSDDKDPTKTEGNIKVQEVLVKGNDLIDITNKTKNQQIEDNKTAKKKAKKLKQKLKKLQSGNDENSEKQIVPITLNGQNNKLSPIFVKASVLTQSDKEKLNEKLKEKGKGRLNETKQHDSIKQNETRKQKDSPEQNETLGQDPLKEQVPEKQNLATKNQTAIKNASIADSSPTELVTQETQTDSDMNNEIKTKSRKVQTETVSNPNSPNKKQQTPQITEENRKLQSVISRLKENESKISKDLQQWKDMANYLTRLVSEKNESISNLEAKNAYLTDSQVVLKAQSVSEKEGKIFSRGFKSSFDKLLYLFKILFEKNYTLQIYSHSYHTSVLHDCIGALKKIMIDYTMHRSWVEINEEDIEYFKSRIDNIKKEYQEFSKILKSRGTINLQELEEKLQTYTNVIHTEKYYNLVKMFESILEHNRSLQTELREYKIAIQGKKTQVNKILQTDLSYLMELRAQNPPQASTFEKPTRERVINETSKDLPTLQQVTREYIAEEFDRKHPPIKLPPSAQLPSNARVSSSAALSNSQIVSSNQVPSSHQVLSSNQVLPSTQVFPSAQVLPSAHLTLNTQHPQIPKSNDSECSSDYFEDAASQFETPLAPVTQTSTSEGSVNHATSIASSRKLRRTLKMPVTEGLSCYTAVQLKGCEELASNALRLPTKKSKFFTANSQGNVESTEMKRMPQGVQTEPRRSHFHELLKVREKMAASSQSQIEIDEFARLFIILYKEMPNRYLLVAIKMAFKRLVGLQKDEMLSRLQSVLDTFGDTSSCDTSTEADQCSICAECFGNALRQSLFCQHDFHMKCLWQWLKDNKTCPTCGVQCLHN